MSKRNEKNKMYIQLTIFSLLRLLRKTYRVCLFWLENRIFGSNVLKKFVNVKCVECPFRSTNIEKRTGGSHTTGLGGFLAARRKLEATLGHPPKAHETFIYNHVKKGKNPFVLKASESSSQLEFVDEKSRLFVEKVKILLSEKHGSNEDDYPDFDPEVWDKCTGGRKKGKFYGSSTSQDPCYVLTGTPYSLSTCSSYATQQPQVQILTQTVEEMQEKHEIQLKEIEETKMREERQRKELEYLKAKSDASEAETLEMKATIAAMMKYLPNMTPPN